MEKRKSNKPALYRFTKYFTSLKLAIYILKIFLLYVLSAVMQVANISDLCYAAQYTGSKTLSALEGVFALGLDKQYYLPKELNKECRKKFIEVNPIQHS